MFENYAALIISILRGTTPEQSFELYNSGKVGVFRDPDKQNATEMTSLKAQGYTYKEIGEMFGISMGSVYKKMKRLKGAC